MESFARSVTTRHSFWLAISCRWTLNGYSFFRDRHGLSQRLSSSITALFMVVMVVVVSWTALTLVSLTGFQHGGLSLGPLLSLDLAANEKGIRNAAFDVCTGVSFIISHFISFQFNTPNSNQHGPTFVHRCRCDKPAPSTSKQASKHIQKHVVLRQRTTQHHVSHWLGVQ